MKEFLFYICDDDNTFAQMINEKISSVLGSDSYASEYAEDGESLVALCKKELPDAVFLDIDMPNLNGFETAEELSRLSDSLRILFVTSHEDKVYESWTYQPFWFVRKSRLDDLDAILPRLVTRLRADRLKGKSVKVAFDDRMVELDLDNLLTVESQGHYVIFNDGGDEELKIRSKISDAEEKLSPFGFVRINKGILVNLRTVSTIKGKRVILSNGEEYTVGRERVAEVKHKFLEYVRGGDI